MPIIVDAWNHCFTGETVVTTIQGDVPIKDIKKGDLVLTRKGYKKVLKTFDNGIQLVKDYCFANNKSLTATDMHSIITPEGKKPIKDITRQDVIYFLLNGGAQWKFIKARNTRRSYLMGNLIEGIRRAKDEAIEFILDALYTTRGLKNQNIYMWRFGNIIKAKFLQDFISTTKIIIHSIMKSITLPLSKEFAIYPAMPSNIITKIKPRVKNILMKLDRSLRNGTGVKREAGGIVNTQNSNIKNYNRSNVFVCSVAKNIFEKSRSALANFVQMLVNQHGEEHPALIMKQESASNAGSYSQPINTQTLRPVQNLAGKERFERVYNLTIEDQHEYFANGILVSNCIDAIRYAHFPRIKGGLFSDLDFEDFPEEE